MAELPDVDPAPLDPLPSAVRIVCVQDLAVLVDTGLRQLHMGSFAKDHSWRHLMPLMGAALPHPPPMQAVCQGQWWRSPRTSRQRWRHWSCMPVARPGGGGGPFGPVDSHWLYPPAPRARVVVQVATRASRALPGGLEDTCQGPRALDALRGPSGQGRSAAQGCVSRGPNQRTPRLAHIAGLLAAPAPS